MSDPSSPLVEQVRAALDVEPDANAFYRLLRLLDRWEGPQDQLPQALALAGELLSGWPDRTRRGDMRWLIETDVVDTSDMWGRSEEHSYRCMREEASPLLALARSIYVTEVKGTGEAAVEVAAAWPEARISHVGLDVSCLAPGGLAALLACPLFERATSLTLAGAPGDEATAALLESGRLRALTELRVSCASFPLDCLSQLAPQLTGLRRLDLSSTGLGPEGVESLISAGVLPKELIVWDNPLGDAGVMALVDAGALRGRRELDLTRTELGPAGVCALADSPDLLEVEALDLTQNEVGDEGAEALAFSRNAARLRRLDLTCSGVGALGVEALLSSPYLSDGVELRLSGNPVGPELDEPLADRGGPDGVLLRLGICSLDATSAQVLFASSALRRVAELDLHENELGVEGARALAASPHLTRLRRLDVSVCVLTDAGLTEVGRAGGLADLRELKIGDNYAGLEGLRGLLGSEHLGSLRALDLNNTHFGPQGAELLAESPLLTKLERLFLLGCGVRQQGALALAASRVLGRLRHLDVRGNDIGGEGKAALLGLGLDELETYP